MKQIHLSFLLTMLMSMIGSTTFAHYIEVVNADGVTIYYNFTNNNTELQVTYRGNYYDSYSNEYTGSVVIPETVSYGGKTYSVTSIGDYAFRGCSGLTSITIPNSVTSIGEGTFTGCNGLNYIAIESGNTVYDSRENCNAIINTSTNEMIAGCNNTVIPNSVTSIGSSAFYGCSGLTSITIPNSVTSIGDYAFQFCSGLTSITIPNSVTSIGISAFRECSGLKEVVFNATNCSSMGSSSHPVFSSCTSLTTLIFGDNVQTIPAYAFSGCSGLTSITIPNSVTSIGDYAFCGCI